MASLRAFSSESDSGSDVGTVAGTAALDDGDIGSHANSSFASGEDDGHFNGRGHSFDSVLSVDLVKVPTRSRDESFGSGERATGIAEFRWRQDSSSYSRKRRHRSRTKDNSTPSRTSATQMFSPENAFVDGDFIHGDAAAWETLLQAHDPMKDGMDEGNMSDGVQLASSYYNAGVRDMLVGSFVTAIQYFSKAAFLIPNESAPLISKAECFAKLSDLKSSIFCYRRVTWILEQREKEEGTQSSSPRSSSAHNRAGQMECARENQMKTLVNRLLTLPRGMRSSSSSSGSGGGFGGGGTRTSSVASRTQTSGANSGPRLEAMQAKLCSLWCEERMNACQLRLVELLHAQSLASFNASLNDDALYYVDEALTQIAALNHRLALDSIRLTTPVLSPPRSNRGRDASSQYSDTSPRSRPESSLSESVESGLRGLESLNPTARLCFEFVERKLVAYERQATIHKCAFLIEGGKDGAAELSLRRFLAPIFSTPAADDLTETSSSSTSLITSELDLHAMLLLADIYRRRRLFSDARQLLDQVEDSEDNAWTSHPDFVDAECAFRTSYDVYRASAIAACDVRAVTRCINTYPDDALLYLARAKGQLSANGGNSQAAASQPGDPDAATPSTTSATPKDSPARHAIRDLFVCIQKSNGGCSEAVELMTTLFLSLGSEQEDSQSDASSAVMYYSEALKWRPENGTVLLARGDCYFKLADYPKAIVDYSKVMALESESRSSRETAAQRLATVHDLLGAHLLSTASALTPYNVNDGSEKPRRTKRVPLTTPPEERKTFLTSTGRNFTVTQFQERRKTLLMEAEDEFSRAVVLDDQEPTWYFHRAICRLQLGATMFALRDVLSCRQLNPQHPTIRQFVAQFQDAVAPPPEPFSKQNVSDCLSTTLPSNFGPSQNNTSSCGAVVDSPPPPPQRMDGSNSYFTPKWASVASPAHKDAIIAAPSSGSRSPVEAKGSQSRSVKQNWKSSSYPPPHAASSRKDAAGSAAYVPANPNLASRPPVRLTDVLPFIGTTSSSVRSSGNNTSQKSRRN